MCRRFDPGPRHRVNFLANLRKACVRADPAGRVNQCASAEAGPLLENGRMSNRPSLDSALEKVNRAGKNLELLDAQVVKFLAEKPPAYAHLIDPYGEGAEQAVIRDMKGGIYPFVALRPAPDAPIDLSPPYVKRFRVRMVVFRDLPALTWGAAIGDIIHDLRSALDNMTWELSRQFAPLPPTNAPIPGGKWLKVQFPITASAGGWQDSCTRNLPFIADPRLLRKFERHQPFFRRKGLPPRTAPAVYKHPLFVLGELSNRDKHRAINVVGGLSTFDHVPPPPSDYVGPPLTFDVLWRKRSGRLVLNGEIARLEVSGAVVTLGALNKYMETKLGLAHEVLFDEGFPGWGQRVDVVVTKIKNRVTRVLADFEPEFR
jgi:hypothetical protein